jgi:hypothetical protein
LDTQYTVYCIFFVILTTLLFHAKEIEFDTFDQSAALVELVGVESEVIPHMFPFAVNGEDEGGVGVVGVGWDGHNSLVKGVFGARDLGVNSNDIISHDATMLLTPGFLAVHKGFVFHDGGWVQELRASGDESKLNALRECFALRSIRCNGGLWLLSRRRLPRIQYEGLLRLQKSRNWGHILSRRELKSMHFLYKSGLTGLTRA